MQSNGKIELKVKLGKYLDTFLNRYIKPTLKVSKYKWNILPNEQPFQKIKQRWSIGQLALGQCLFLD